MDFLCCVCVCVCVDCTKSETFKVFHVSDAPLVSIFNSDICSLVCDFTVQPGKTEEGKEDSSQQRDRLTSFEWF